MCDPSLTAPLPSPLPASASSPLQGTDARLSGHFTYTTTPAFLELRLAPALRCTNRAGVEAWLASFGLTAQLPEGAVQ